MQVKALQWEKSKPEVFEDFCYKAFIRVLNLNGKPAYYQVSKINDNIKSTLWVNNGAITVCNYNKDIDAGKTKCQEHLESLIVENCNNTK